MRSGIFPWQCRRSCCVPCRNAGFTEWGAIHLFPWTRAFWPPPMKTCWRKWKPGQFRRDLYYRLDELSIRVPPLRERAEDILFLAHNFLHVACEELGKSILDITIEAAEILQVYPWPGNVRELRNLIRRAALFADGPVTRGHLLLAGLTPMVTSRDCQTASDMNGSVSFRELVPSAPARRNAKSFYRSSIKPAEI